MKYFKRILTFLFLFFCVITLTGCGNKKKISIEEFKKKMEEKDFVVSDASNQVESNKYIKKIYVAIEKDSNFQIEFYELSSNDNAVSFYNNNKALFEASKTTNSNETKKSIKNYSKYSLESKNSYKLISRIDNTVIHVNSDSKYKTEIDNTLSEIGY